MQLQIRSLNQFNHFYKFRTELIIKLMMWMASGCRYRILQEYSLLMISVINSAQRVNVDTKRR